MTHGFIRVAAATPPCTVADCAANAAGITELAFRAAERGASLVAFPELSVTGYTAGDLFAQETLAASALAAVRKIAAETSALSLALIVGFPLNLRNARYNCAAVIHAGRVLGVVPKTHIPNYGEFYELRHFAAAPAPFSEIPAGILGDESVPFGTDLLFADTGRPELAFAVEICEDLWVPSPPSSAHVQAGAVIVANLSASNEIIGKAEYRRSLVIGQSGRGMCAYLYADAGTGESTTDMVFAGHNLIAENGSLLAESALFSSGLLVADVDADRLLQERRRVNTFRNEGNYRAITCPLAPSDPTGKTPRGDSASGSAPFADRSGGLLRAIPRHPFVPSDRNDLARRCEEILSLQTAGLAKRLSHTKSRSAVIGLSGGLDSTLALFVTVRAFDLLGLDRSGILAITMPGFGTTKRTRGNALALAELLGTATEEISINKAVRQHFADIGHDGQTLDVTYENSQARERTQILMDKANQTGGLVIGTGDLSELALGWATYNGDHMSMYAVNASIPKTLVRHLVRYCADQPSSFIADEAGRKRFAKVLVSILETPVSPELLPPKDGEIAQKTEHIVGPYELHDFFLYYATRWGFAPAKVFALAAAAFSGEYDRLSVLGWMKVFYRRFFSQQFKRSCLPDGPKVGSVTLSPRSDWRMPSDASAAAWLAEIDELEARERDGAGRDTKG